MKVGFTGSRSALTAAAKETLRKYFETTNTKISALHHGDCVGADEFAHNLAVAHKIPVVIHPPTDDKCRARCSTGAKTERPAKPFLERNHNIVDETDALLAAPPTAEELLRSGSWATIRYARKKKTIYLVLPNGEMKTETIKNANKSNNKAKKA